MEEERKTIKCAECDTDCYEDETMEGCCLTCALAIAGMNAG